MSSADTKSPQQLPSSATIRDVAKEAGVSIATISRVFSGSARVSTSTAERVRKVASELGYWPNGAARSLITKRTHALGILLPDLYGGFFSEVIRGADLAARSEGYHLILSSSHPNSEKLLDALRSMRGRIDGLIAMAPHIEDPETVCGVTGKLPVVLVTPGRKVDGCHSISIDDFEGARAMARHLMELGHRNIAFIKGPSGNIEAQQRLEGYRAALQEGGLEASEKLIFDGDFNESGGYEAALRILETDTRPTAVFSSNDYTAVGVLRAFRERGVRVPEEIAVTGFDDIELAEFTTPPLSTVRVEMYQLGERAVRLLLDSIGDGVEGSAGRHELLPTSVIVRDSCGARRTAEHGRSRGD